MSCSIAGASQTWHPQCPTKTKAALGFVQIGPHHSVHLMHEQHGINLTKNAKEVNPSVIVYGLLRTFALIEGHH